MKRWILAILVLATASCTELIAPEDPLYEDVCVIYVAENERAEVSKSVFERCVSVSIVVVKFPI